MYCSNYVVVSFLATRCNQYFSLVGCFNRFFLNSCFLLLFFLWFQCCSTIVTIHYHNMPVVEHYFSVFKSVQWQICECKLLGIFRLKPQLLPKYMEPAFWSNTLAPSMWVVIHLHKSKVAHQIHGGMFSSLADYWSLLLTQRGDTQEVVGIEAKRHQQVGYQNSNGFLHRLSISADFFFFGGGLESLSHKTRRFSTTFWY